MNTFSCILFTVGTIHYGYYSCYPDPQIKIEINIRCLKKKNLTLLLTNIQNINTLSKPFNLGLSFLVFSVVKILNTFEYDKKCYFQ